MDLAYLRARTRALVAEIRVAFTRCRSCYPGTQRRCMKPRRHGSPYHWDGQKAWRDGELSPSHGHMHVVPENGRRR